MAITKSAVRVVCVDADQRVLLLKWLDPVDGSIHWSSPGGGIEAGESPFEAACREMKEETGLTSAQVSRHSMPVVRDFWWAGHHFVGEDRFFLARVTDTTTAERELSVREQASLVGQEWFTWDAIQDLDEHVEPPSLAKVLTELMPEGPWHGA